MARKVEPDLIEKNRARIIEAAKELFIQDGIENTKTNDIAKLAGMSKSTLYVYFRSKEDIVNCLSLEAMTFFYNELKTRLENSSLLFHDKYVEICNIMVDFKMEYPLSFQLLVEEICVDDGCLRENQVLQEIYEIGEKVNHLILRVLTENSQKANMEDLFVKIFSQWGSIYGLIVLADNKEAYIEKNMHMTKKEFLSQGFEQLFKSII
ncbi:MAG: TetR/AcrR family transcriptional regulator [Velocimicrobium sp.]